MALATGPRKHKRYNSAMSRTVSLTLAVIGGMAGGLATRFVGPPAAHAQQAPAAAPPVAELRAASFVLVDSANRPVGTFTTEKAGQRSRIVLEDATGREIWSAGGSGIRPVNSR